MKKLLFLLLSGIPMVILHAQSYEGSVDYQRKGEKAMVIDFPYSPSIVEDAIVEKMEKLGYKKRESKGFLVYKDAIIADISSERADYMIKVERKSRREKDESTVFLIISRGDENMIARSDALLNSNVKTFLNRLVPHVQAYNLEHEILAQEAVVAKAEKKLKDLKEDQESLEKKIKNLQEDLGDNAKNQQGQQKEIDNEKQVLDAMRNKRKPA
jgi:hypothetical protein